MLELFVVSALTLSYNIIPEPVLLLEVSVANYATYDLPQLEEARQLILNALRRTKKELEEVEDAIETHKKRLKNNVVQEAPA